MSTSMLVLAIKRLHKDLKWKMPPFPQILGGRIETTSYNWSKNETVRLAKKKEQCLKQNRSWFCFKSCIFLSCFILFHELDLTQMLRSQRWMV
jgi:hypothetical protein